MNAQISSCRTGERRVQELVEKFGVETFEAAVDEILDHGERLTRSRLANLPKGTWTAVDYADDDGIDRDTLVKIQATVTVTDDEVVIDFAGSHPATEGPINIPIGCTIGIGALVFKALTTPDTPANEGNFRPLRVEAPPGCVMHAVPPAPTFTLWTALLAVDVVMKAFAQGMPDVIPACSGGDIFSVMGVGVHPQTGKVWLESSNEGVGFGAHSGGDGDNGLMHMTEPGLPQQPDRGARGEGAAARRGLHAPPGLGRRRPPPRRARPPALVPVPRRRLGADAREEDEDGAVGNGRRRRRRRGLRPPAPRHRSRAQDRHGVRGDGALGRPRQPLGRRRRLGRPVRARPAGGARGRRRRVRVGRERARRLRRRRSIPRRRRSTSRRPQSCEARAHGA